MVTMQLICVFVLAYAKSRSHDAAQINCFYESRIIQLSKISQASNFCNANIMQTGPCNVIVRLSILRKTILIPEYLAFMCVCVFVDGCISQF